MRRNRLYAFAVVVTVAAVAGPALAGTVHFHAAKPRTTTKVGPRGPRGARGPRGVAGPAGRSGANGANGTNGVNGENGSNNASVGSFVRTVVVSPSGSTPGANGALLLAAVAGIGTPAAGNPYLVWVEPGVYDLGTTTLNVPSHVDVQGSGADVTTIEGEGPLALSTAATTEVRELTVTDTNSSGSAEAIDTSGGLHDVTATASGTSAATAVLANAPTMPIVNVDASGTTSAPGSSARGIDTLSTARIDGGSYSAFDNAPSSQSAALFAESATLMTDATLQATGGSADYPVDVVGSSATVRIEDSTLAGTGGFFVAPGDTLDVGGSQIPGVVASVSGTANCPDDWLVDYATANADCS